MGRTCEKMKFPVHRGPIIGKIDLLRGFACHPGDFSGLLTRWHENLSIGVEFAPRKMRKNDGNLENWWNWYSALFGIFRQFKRLIDYIVVFLKSFSMFSRLLNRIPLKSHAQSAHKTFNKYIYGNNWKWLLESVDHGNIKQFRECPSSVLTGNY